MFKSFILFSILSLFSFNVFTAPSHGDVQVKLHNLTVWHKETSIWISPEQFFAIEIKRYDGQSYGTVTEYPPYDTVIEFDTLIDKLPDGRICPMVFFHQRWRRLPDVLALDERLRNYGGCKDVFNQ